MRHTSATLTSVISLALYFSIVATLQECTRAQCDRGDLSGPVQRAAAQFDAGSELLLLSHLVETDQKLQVADLPFGIVVIANERQLSSRIEGVLSSNRYDDGALYDQAVLEWVAGQHRSAIHTLNRIHNLVPEDPIYGITLAECEDAVGNLAGASTTIKGLLAIYPWLSFSKWFDQFDARHGGVGMTLLREVLDSVHSSNDSHDAMIRGWIYLRLGRQDLAYAQFTKATRQQSLGRAWLGLAITLMSQGDLPSSRMAVARAGYLGAAWSTPHDFPTYTPRAALIYKLPMVRNRRTLILVDGPTLLEPSLPLEKVATLQ